MTKFHEKLLAASKVREHLDSIHAAIGATLAHKAITHQRKDPLKVASELQNQNLLAKAKSYGELLTMLQVAQQLARAQQVRIAAAIKHVKKLKKQGKI